MERKVEIINEKDHPDIYNWLVENVVGSDYLCSYNQKKFILTSEGEINAYCDVILRSDTKGINHPFGTVYGNFACSSCPKLNSLINSPKIVIGNFLCGWCCELLSLEGCPHFVDGNFEILGCDKLKTFKNFPLHVKDSVFLSYDSVFLNVNYNFNHNYNYNVYINNWNDFLISIPNKKRIEYLTIYGYKINKFDNKPVIPKVVFDKYKIDSLLK